MFLQHYMEAGSSFGRSVAPLENIIIQRLEDLTIKLGSDFINDCKVKIGLRRALAEKVRRASTRISVLEKIILRS